jgi:hypothetical protein
VKESVECAPETPSKSPEMNAEMYFAVTTQAETKQKEK